jgi:hypothetical protein
MSILLRHETIKVVVLREWGKFFYLIEVNQNRLIHNKFMEVWEFQTGVIVVFKEIFEIHKIIILHPIPKIV